MRCLQRDELVHCAGDSNLLPVRAVLAIAPQ